MFATTAADIRTAALIFNAEYPEAAAEIAAGTVEVLVTVGNTTGTGWNLQAVVQPGVRLPNGQWAGAYENNATIEFKARDGRMPREQLAEKLLRPRMNFDADVAVTYQKVGF